VAAFLADSAGQADEDAAAADGNLGDEGLAGDGFDDGDGHARYEDDGEGEEFGASAEAWQQQQQQRRQSSGGHSVLGLGGSGVSASRGLLCRTAQPLLVPST
jgi:hypothetical protein